MANTMRDLGAEFEERLSFDEYQAAAEYLNIAVGMASDAIRENTEKYDAQINKYLWAAVGELISKGENRAAEVVKYYTNFF